MLSSSAISKKIVIIGAGPTGLGAAYRLYELGYHDWEIYERNAHIGGLAASFESDGFIWDIAGHVIFSSYGYVNDLFDRLLGHEYSVHQRNAWIWVLHHWVPYPFQSNIRYLPKEKVVECLLGLIKAQANKNSPMNFKEWILSTFGDGIAKYFMLPYNRKLWAYPLELMDTNWTSERISVVNIERVLTNVIYKRDDLEWGNSLFKTPLYGGTGGLFSRFKPYIKDHLFLGEEVVSVDTSRKLVKLSSGRETSYDILLNTMPLDQFIYKLSRKPDALVESARLLKHNSIFSVGIGIKKPCPSDKCWIYFPEKNYCFHRISYFSNYSPNNVPDPVNYHSVICETSYSKYKPESKDKIVDKTIDGLVKTGLISESDRKLIVATHLLQSEYAYPIPTLETGKALRVINGYLGKKKIYSRGRFGAWEYGMGNMDHSIMQGVETIDKILSRDRIRLSCQLSQGSSRCVPKVKTKEN